MEEGRSTFKILIGTPARKRSRWEDNIRMDLKEIGINARNRLKIGIIGEPPGSISRRAS